MPGTVLVDSDMADLVAMTHRHEGRLKFQQIAQELQEYEVMPRILKKDRVMFGSGRGIQRNLMHTIGGTARHQGLLDEDQFNIPDLLAQMTVDWVLASDNYSWLETEVLENRGREMILNILKPRRIACLMRIAKELEDKFFADAADSDVNPWGLLYWIVKNSSAGFNGGAPFGTTIAGLTMTSYPNFYNYTNTYSTFSKTGNGILRIMRKMHRYTGWRNVVDVPDYRGAKGNRYRIYVNEETADQYEMMVESQNENLGVDVAPIDGNTMVFKGHPIIVAWKLVADTTNPVYFCDTATFHPVILSGMYLKETGPRPWPKQHLAWAEFVDLRYNFLCVDRRRNGVIYQA